MIRFINISVLVIYFITSCFVIWSNQLTSDKDPENESLADVVISVMTIPVSDNPDDGNLLPVFFKDPSEDKSIVLNYYPSFTSFEFVSIHYSFQVIEKLKDPFLNIFSPPPQLL